MYEHFHFSTPSHQSPHVSTQHFNKAFT
jgi:hypothetical protein